MFRRQRYRRVGGVKVRDTDYFGDRVSADLHRGTTDDDIATGGGLTQYGELRGDCRRGTTLDLPRPESQIVPDGEVIEVFKA